MLCIDSSWHVELGSSCTPIAPPSLSHKFQFFRWTDRSLFGSSMWALLHRTSIHHLYELSTHVPWCHLSSSLIANHHHHHHHHHHHLLAVIADPHVAVESGKSPSWVTPVISVANSREGQPRPSLSTPVLDVFVLVSGLEYQLKPSIIAPLLTPEQLQFAPSTNTPIMIKSDPD